MQTEPEATRPVVLIHRANIDFKYGYFECRAKVPTGKGYLPAFWMMPTDENLYGQWPKCGEIDIMEVMGQETNKAYGTIHYGDRMIRVREPVR